MSGARIFTPEEDELLIRETLAGTFAEDIGKLIDRSGKAVQRRCWVLRRMKRLPQLEGQPAWTKDHYIGPSTGITLKDDDTLVRRCLAEGGFPRAVITDRGTAWAGPDGKPWRHTQNLRTVQALAKAAA